MSEKSDSKPDSKPTETRVELGQGPEVPPEVSAALGGSPIPMPGSKAGRVEPSPLPVEIAAAERVGNPLFDAPSRTDLVATADVARLREAFGRALLHAQAASALGEKLLDDSSLEFKAAAKREGFDLTAAAKVAKEFSDLVEKHKPAKKQ